MVRRDEEEEEERFGEVMEWNFGSTLPSLGDLSSFSVAILYGISTAATPPVVGRGWKVGLKYVL